LSDAWLAIGGNKYNGPLTHVVSNGFELTVDAHHHFIGGVFICIC
jgi:hypothetical protein